MKSLKESLFDIDTDISKEDMIRAWIEKHCKYDGLKIDGGKVYARNIELKPDVVRIPTDLFTFVKVTDFDCYGCDKLVSLEGSPEECGYFDCSKCTSLKTLKGAPKYVKYFICSGCSNLESLDIEESIITNMQCSHCDSLKTLKGAPKTEEFTCMHCRNLESLEGLPSRIGFLNCSKCPKLKSPGNVKTAEGITFIGSPLDLRGVRCTHHNP